MCPKTTVVGLFFIISTRTEKISNCILEPLIVGRYLGIALNNLTVLRRHQIQITDSHREAMDSRPLAVSSDNSVNLPPDLTVNDKGKFRWSGSFEHLEAMMNNILDKQIVWTSSGGYRKKMELDDLCVRKVV